jgi:hypothetical protein
VGIDVPIEGGFRRETSLRTLLKDATRLAADHVKQSIKRFRKETEPAVQPTAKKAYASPTLRKLTLEQARLRIVAHAGVQDIQNSELAEILFEQPTATKTEKACDEPLTRGGSVPGETSGRNHPEEGGSTPTPPPQF